MIFLMAFVPETSVTKLVTAYPMANSQNSNECCVGD